MDAERICVVTRGCRQDARAVNEPDERREWRADRCATACVVHPGHDTSNDIQSSTLLSVR